ncbi:family 20 glycosylhydrolase [Marinimicrobium alkaliphilum]|uniref:family 20 glycosylhydrolase n=1 Tax=Marinimicrobium alkaliphilum TaxID=2202654 RepID=UPI001E2EC923|nr:family 20 glycosylhydrolase [Marinimicrobium alkaliphilum]
MSLSIGAHALSQSDVNTFAEGASLRFAVLSNLAGGGPHIRLQLENPTSVSLPGGEADWAIYFHSVRRIATVEEAGLRLSHVQGDLHRLASTADFAGLASGQTVTLDYRASAHMISYTDFMPRAFLVSGDAEPVVFANTDTEDIRAFVEPIERADQRLRSHSDAVSPATAASRYDANRRVNAVEVSASDVRERIIPKPSSVNTRRGTVTLSGDWSIHYAGRLASEAAFLQAALSGVFEREVAARAGDGSGDGPVVILRVDPEARGLPEAAESYILTLERDRIEIIGRDNAGAFYGAQSLLNLLPARVQDGYALPRLTVVDSPRASWRGMHYDMARNFHGKAVTLRLIDQMARYKLNRLHLHLTEDEGWRLEIPGLPELTDIGGHRCFDLSERRCLLTQLGTGPHTSGSGNGYYSRDDFIEILRYAAERHIEVIPEIDMPGHARAAVKAMDARYQRLMEAGEDTEARRYLLADPDDTSEYLTVQNYSDNSINVCMESTYAFIDKVMYELQAMYREAGQSLGVFHLGGDEVGRGSWTGSPECEALIRGESGLAGTGDLMPYFVSRVAELASHRGLAVAAWEDGMMHDAQQPFNRDRFENDRVLVNPWDNIWEWGAGDRAYRFANAGYEVILSHATHLYFDHPHEAHPEERGYYWATRYTDTEKVFGYLPDYVYANATTNRNGEPIEDLETLLGRAVTPLKKPENILGIQGQVWTETIRTAEQLEAMLYPRVIALAERAWHRAGWEGEKPDTRARDQDYARFVRVLATRELPKLLDGGAGFHLLPPGARVDQGQLHANTAMPGLTIEYSTDGGSSWQPYHGSVAMPEGEVVLRTRLGHNVSRSTLVE